MLQIQLVTACEGPLALNDLPFELCREFIQPHGDRFFRQVSRYDDYLAEIAKRPESQAGAFLTMILPFLMAQGATNDLIRDFSLQNLRLVSGAEAAYHFLHRFGFPIFGVSTSYGQFAAAVGSKLGFKADQIFCTELDLEQFHLHQSEAEELHRLEEEIAASPDIELPPGATDLADLPGPSQEAIVLLERVFGERLPVMEIGGLLREVKPLGAPEKSKAVSDSLSRSGCLLANTIYVGDGKTDVQALEAVRAGGGLAISFNGDRHAIQAAEIVAVSDSVWSMAMLVAIFRLWGKEGVLEVASPERRGKSRTLVLPEDMIEPIALGLQDHQFNLYMADDPRREKIIRESEAMQARLRGEAIATGEVSK